MMTLLCCRRTLIHQMEQMIAVYVRMAADPGPSDKAKVLFCSALQLLFMVIALLARIQIAMAWLYVTQDLCECWML